MIAKIRMNGTMLVMAAAPPPAACAYAGVTNIERPRDSGAQETLRSVGAHPI